VRKLLEKISCRGAKDAEMKNERNETVTNCHGLKMKVRNIRHLSIEEAGDKNG